MIHLIPIIPGLWIGGSRLRNCAKQRIDFLLIGADNHIRHYATKVVFYCKSSNGKHLRHVRIGFILHCNHVLIGIALIGHGTAVGLDIHDICSGNRQC